MAIDDQQFQITEMMIELIDHVKNHACLYNTNYIGYRNYKLKAVIWDSIAELMHVKGTTPIHFTGFILCAMFNVY